MSFAQVQVRVVQVLEDGQREDDVDALARDLEGAGKVCLQKFNSGHWVVAVEREVHRDAAPCPAGAAQMPQQPVVVAATQVGYDVN